MPNIIETKDLRFEYTSEEEGARVVLNGVDLKIRKGEFVAVLGHNGSGKSTLAKHFNAMLLPSGGKCFVAGMDTADEEKRFDIRQTVGMVLQNPDNQLVATIVEEDVAFGPENMGVPPEEIRKRVDEALKAVGMYEYRRHAPHKLSGGQKQRIAIARALACDPKILLCDEATSALDPKTTRDILRLIKDINRRLGITVVVITHEMAVVEEICTHVAILDHGRVMETGTVEQVFSNPRTEAGRRLVYPDGVVIDQLPAANVIRIAFNGGSSYEPLIASLAIDCGVKVNILGADTRNVNGQAFGTMLLGLPEDPAEAAKAVSYIKNQPNVTMEEVRDYHG